MRIHRDDDLTPTPGRVGDNSAPGAVTEDPPALFWWAVPLSVLVVAFLAYVVWPA